MQVRHNTLTVLTHLVLNDMVKVRGQVSEMALCLEDADERIQDMARLFFGEFKLKQQGIYIDTHTHTFFFRSSCWRLRFSYSE